MDQKQKQKKLFECPTYAEHGHCSEEGIMAMNEPRDDLSDTGSE